MTRQERKACLKKERDAYPSLSTPLKRFYAFMCQDRDYFVYHYIRLLRFSEYYYIRKKRNKLYYPLYIFYKSQKNKLGQQLGIDVGEDTFAPGLYIAHTGIIVGSAKIGQNCKLHGQNCIGSGVTIGNDCELWVGAKVVGHVHLADGITVAAGAVVINSFEEKNITIGGIPARRLR